MTRRRRHGLLGLAVAIFALATVAIAVVLMGAVRGGEEEAAGEAEYPTALGKHLEKLKEATPGNPGMAEEGPSSAAESAFFERAFPADTISVAQMEGVRSAAAAANGRPFPTGKGRKGTWVSIGPSEALYPFERFRNCLLYTSPSPRDS